MACCNACAQKELITNTKEWIQKAIKHPGSFKAYAKAHDGLDADGNVKRDWAEKVANDESLDPKVRKRASLFLTLMKMHSKG